MEKIFYWKTGKSVSCGTPQKKDLTQSSSKSLSLKQTKPSGQVSKSFKHYKPWVVDNEKHWYCATYNIVFLALHLDFQGGILAKSKPMPWAKAHRALKPFINFCISVKPWEGKTSYPLVLNLLNSFPSFFILSMSLLPNSFRSFWGSKMSN